MAKKSSNKSKVKNRSSVQVHVDGNLTGNAVVGNNNFVTNIISPEKIKLNALHQLPPAPADFTGRDELISQLLSDFNSHKGATISGLTGMGGIGKTALGLFVANQIKDKYPDAQFFLDLKGTTQPLTALDIVRHIILSFEPTADIHGLDESNMQAAYQSVLHGKKVLLFFDNVRSAEQIAPLHTHADCNVLLTSRWTFAIPGLQFHRVGVLDEEDAAKFLLELCTRIGDKAAELAKACAYLPLALRIAGSFLLVNNDWSIEKYLSQLNNRKKRLETLKQSRIDAELTTDSDLLATFELSYNSLEKEDQKRWRALGVFPTSFTKNAAQFIWSLEEREGIKLLGTFRRHGLLDFDATTSRYFLHDLLADFAFNSQSKKDKFSAKLNYSNYYLQILHISGENYNDGGRNAIEGLRLFDEERVNILSGQNWAVKNYKKGNVAKICSLYSGALSCIRLRLTLNDQRRWIESSLVASRFLKDRKSEAVHLSNLATIFHDLADMQEAIRLSKKSIRISKKDGNFDVVGASLTTLANTYGVLGKPHKALQYYWERLDLAHQHDDAYNIYSTLLNIAVTFSELGDFEGAMIVYTELTSIFHRNKDYQGEAMGYFNLGRCAFLVGHPNDALKCFEKSLNLFKKIGDVGGKAQVLISRGLVYIFLKRYDNVITDGEEALAILRKLNKAREEVFAMQFLCMAYEAIGDIKKSRFYYKKAREGTSKIGINNLDFTNFALSELLMKVQHYDKL